MNLRRKKLMLMLLLAEQQNFEFDYHDFDCYLDVKIDVLKICNTNAISTLSSSLHRSCVDFPFVYSAVSMLPYV